MNWKVLFLFSQAGLIAAFAGYAQPATQPHALEDFQRRAASFNAVIVLPQFDLTASAVRALVRETIATSNAAMDRIAALKPHEVSFENTIRALDDIGFQVDQTDNRLSVLKETSTSAALRSAATDALKQLEEWMVGLEYRVDVYRAVKAYADTKPSLQGEDAKLLVDTMRDYRRTGLDLPGTQRDEVERMRKELSGLATDFESNINKATKSLKFARADLEGLPDDFLQQIKVGDDEYALKVNVTVNYSRAMDNLKKETRKKLLIARENLARAGNIPLLQKILVLRDDVAGKLGYKTWADYQTEVKMARNSATVMEFLEKLKTGLQPKFDAELAELRDLKAKETGDPHAVFHAWDYRYFVNQLKKEKYAIDAEQLRVYFPYQRCLDGMFAIYQRIFGLKFARIEPPYKWIADLQLYAVSDSESGEPLGLFYLDMFPREGKYNHFAHFAIIPGKLLAGGKYQRPTVALICNFPSPTTGKPSLLSHHDVETLFHEFGHAMHSIMTRARYARFSGTSVPRDFVEAPSQMLENWVWDKKVLDSFAADYRDPAKKIPGEVLARLKVARLATEGSFYRRQLSLALTDMALHTRIHAANAFQAVAISNSVLSDVFLPEPHDTAFVAYFGHLMHYSAGYYGYAWADAIAADMATEFEKSPDGFFDAGVGRRLRNEIYAPGDSRDIEISIEKFLGRRRSLDPFLKKIGISSTVR